MVILDLIPSPDAAKSLGIKPQTLRHWRVQGRSPDYIRIGKRVFYRIDVLKSWLDSHTFSNTSQETEKARAKP